MYVLEFYDSLKHAIGRVPLDGPVTIGRGSNRDVRLAHPTVSRNHARFLFDGVGDHRKVLLLDEGSSNGSFVNGRRVDGSSPVIVRPGDQIRIGVYGALVTLEEKTGTEDGGGNHGPLEFGSPANHLDSIPVERLRVLYTFSCEAVGLERAALLEKTAKTVKACLRFDVLTILLRREGRSPWSRTWNAEATLVHSRDLPSHSGIMDLCARERRIVLSERHDDSFHECTLSLGERTTTVCVPLDCGGECVGALYVEETAEAYDFHDIQFILLLASTVARNLISTESGQEAADQPEHMEGDLTASHDHLFEPELDELDHRTAVLIAARDTADEANRTKSEFLANMSHELRTPLHAILSFAGFGLKKYASAEPEKLRSYFEKIQQSGSTLLELVNGLLDLAKLEAGKATFDFQRTGLKSLIGTVVDEFASLAGEKRLSIEWKSPEFPAKAMVDHTRLKQVVRNLLGNAVKFSPDGGRVEVTLEKEHNSFVVTVRDQGPGIPESELALIFQKFMQASNTKSKAGGTGLGLSICYMIVAAHGGRISAENHPDGGAVFSFRIPADLPVSG